VLYRDDGSTWNVASGVGTASNPVPGEAHFSDLYGQTVDASSVSTGSLDVNGQSGVALPTDVSGSRSIGTWETNNIGSPIEVYVSLEVSNTDASADDRLAVALHINDSQSDFVVSQDQAQTSDGGNMIVAAAGLVPEGAEYKADLTLDDTNSATIRQWVEGAVGL